ncbi:MAG: acetylornithine deacetylase [Gammaproteobacteria bacterium SG8_31]|jgi:acetylornithine deacetylase|nr:MAG: acetylornithine deacetylase [Gammaproteobacteria bacterium SG8_31]
MTHTLPPLETMIRRLVAIPSVSSVQPDLDTGNLGVCETLAEWADTLGFSTDVIPVPGQAGKFNLIARLGAGEGGLVLSGHTDTVPWDEGRWSQDPFDTRVRDGRIYGLGTADMKSFLAVALWAASEFPGTRLKAPLTILGTADEESTMSGARALAESGRPLGRFAVIGEPTNLRPVSAHKGIVMEGIRITGRSGHSSNPALGRNALEGMLRVAAVLDEIRADFAKTYRAPEFEVPEPTINLGHIHGGDSANRICARCEMHIDVRLNPGMTVDSVRSVIRERIRRELRGSGLDVDFDALFEGVNPLAPGAMDELVRVCEAETGLERGAVCFGTEGPFLQGLGMETVIMGPGSIDQAHQPDEYLELASAVEAVDLVGRLIHRFCAEPAEEDW